MVDNELEHTEIKVTRGDGDTLTMTIHRDADIYGWVDIIRIMLLWLTFHPETIDRVLVREDGTLADDNYEDNPEGE